MLYNLRKARQSRTASILSGSHSDSAGQRENDSSAISHTPPRITFINTGSSRTAPANLRDSATVSSVSHRRPASMPCTR